MIKCLNASMPQCLNDSMDFLGDPIQHLVVSSRERQEPGLAVVHPERRSRKRYLGERVVSFSLRDPLRHLLTMVGGHGHAVSRISEGEVNSVDLTGVGH